MNGKNKNFKIVAGILIFTMFTPFILPFSKNVAYAGSVLLPDDYQPEELDTVGEDSPAFKSSRAFADGTAESLVSVTAGCGQIADRFSRIITTIETQKKVTLTLDQVNDFAVGTAQPTADVIKALKKAGSDAPESSSTTRDEEAIAQLKKLNEEAKASAKRDEQAKIWNECLSGIAIKIAKDQLALMTQSIVNWVNTGFGGNALFIKDREAFFNKIEDDNLQAFISPLTDPTLSSLYPFGKDVARFLVNNSKSSFSSYGQSTLQNSLPEGTTPEDFNNDFSRGGWNAWLSLTQNPANNPLGFSMLAIQESSRQAEEKIQEKKDELIQGKGFLSVTRCVEYKETEQTVGTGKVSQDSFTPSIGKSVTFDPARVTMKKNGFSMSGIVFSNLDTNGTTQIRTGKVMFSLVTATGGSLVAPIQVIPNTSATFSTSFDNLTENVKYKLHMSYASASKPTEPEDIAVFSVSISPKESVVTDPTSDENCLRREITTPGTIVADQVSAVLTSPVRQLELADTVNKSLESVFGAMINQLTTKGFTSLASNVNDNYTNNGTGLTGIKYYNSVGNLITVNKGYGGWSGQNVKFDITKDLGDIYTVDKNGNKVVIKKGIISIQEDYITAANNTKKSLVPIIRSVGNLDYCIPGPNPNWTNVANERVSDMKTYIASQSYDGRNLSIKPLWATASKDLSGVVAITAVIAPPVGTIIASAIAIGAKIWDAVQSSKNEKNQSKILDNKAYGEDLFYKNIAAQLNGIDREYNKYESYINGRYGQLESQLPMAANGLSITKNISTYAVNINEAYIDYEKQTNTAKLNIQKLKVIKTKVDKIVDDARKRRIAQIASMRRAGDTATPPYTVNFCPGVDAVSDSRINATSGDALGGPGGFQQNAGLNGECNDTIDNDGDGFKDTDDIQCHSDLNPLDPFTYVGSNNES